MQAGAENYGAMGGGREGKGVRHRLHAHSLFPSFHPSREYKEDKKEPPRIRSVRRPGLRLRDVAWRDGAGFLSRQGKGSIKRGEYELAVTLNVARN